MFYETMCSKKILTPLIINRPYLFDNSPGGECLRTFVRSLNKELFTPTIYASNRTPLVNSDGEHIKLTKEYRFVRYIAAAIRRVLIPDFTNLPGYEWFSWGIGAKNAILNDIKKGAKYDYIHSVSFPCSSHKVALEIKKKTGLPWIMQLYDPWADNPYRIFKTKYFKKIDWKQERECVENADLIIHDNQAIADLWECRYGKEIRKKIVVLPLTVPLPKIEVKANIHKTGEILRISHIGNFMLNRTSQPFIYAVDKLLKKYPKFRDKLKINYIGCVTEPEKELIKTKGLCSLFNLTGPISGDKCIEFYMNSDVFLAIDGANKDNLFFPSKILKYYYFCRPILGITPNESVLDIELKQSGHTSIDNANIDGIVEYLEKALTNYESLLNYNHDYWTRFSPRNVSEQYINIINSRLNFNK